MGAQHYLPLNWITARVIVEGISAGLSFLRRVRDYDGVKGRCGSIGWNYMPYSGGSIVHPHLQVLAGPEPGNYHRALLEKSAAYHREHGGNCWAELVAQERRAGERYLWQTGSLHWLATFAPRGFADITVVFPERATVEDSPGTTWKAWPKAA